MTKKHSTTTKKMRSSGSPPNSPTAWHHRYPQTQEQRSELELECGQKCIATHEDGRLLNPLCQYRSRKDGRKHVTCEIDPVGCRAAMSRARLNRREDRLSSVREKCKKTLGKLRDVYRASEKS
jgi:hypothetical protein